MRKIGVMKKTETKTYGRVQGDGGTRSFEGDEYD
jgi:hypothetical protein